jgi:hypothetical protein
MSDLLLVWVGSPTLEGDLESHEDALKGWRISAKECAELDKVGAKGLGRVAAPQ